MIIEYRKTSKDDDRAKDLDRDKRGADSQTQPAHSTGKPIAGPMETTNPDSDAGAATGSHGGVPSDANDMPGASVHEPQEDTQRRILAVA